MTYNDFINSILSARGRFSITDGYKERHHILPRCKGVTNDPLNLIDLTALEHVTAHRLLAQENPTDFQLVNAYNIMTSTHTVSDEEAALSRELFAGVMSIKMKNNNPMFDKNTKDKHAARCASSEFRSNVSAGMKTSLCHSHCQHRRCHRAGGIANRFFHVAFKRYLHYLPAPVKPEQPAERNAGPD